MEDGNLLQLNSLRIPSSDPNPALSPLLRNRRLSKSTTQLFPPSHSLSFINSTSDSNINTLGISSTTTGSLKTSHSKKKKKFMTSISNLRKKKKGVEKRATFSGGDANYHLGSDRRSSGDSFVKPPLQRLYTEPVIQRRPKSYTPSIKTQQV